MKARFRGQCAKCNSWIEAGEECEYDSAARKISHRSCRQEPASQETAEAIADRLGFFAANLIHERETTKLGERHERESRT